MRLRVPVPVKTILTEKRKMELIKEAKEQFTQIELQLEQLRFQKKKLFAEAMKKGNDAVMDVEDRMDYEESRRREKLESLEIRLTILESLKAGETFEGDSIDAEIDVNVGDSWDDIINNSAIIVKDGIVVEIRKGGKS